MATTIGSVVAKARAASDAKAKDSYVIELDEGAEYLFSFYADSASDFANEGRRAINLLRISWRDGSAVVLAPGRTVCLCTAVCDCQSPYSEPALVSNECPEHNLYPAPHPDCPIHDGFRIP